MEQLAEAGTELAVEAGATDLEQEIGASAGPSHLLGFVHAPVDQEVGGAFSERCADPQPGAMTFGVVNPDKGFSGCGLETIAGLKVELGLERVDLVGGDGGDDVNEGVDDGSMPGQIEGRELLDVADDGLGHVPGIEQSFILQR